MAVSNVPILLLRAYLFGFRLEWTLKVWIKLCIKNESNKVDLWLQATDLKCRDVHNHFRCANTLESFKNRIFKANLPLECSKVCKLQHSPRFLSSRFSVNWKNFSSICEVLLVYVQARVKLYWKTRPTKRQWARNVFKDFIESHLTPKDIISIFLFFSNLKLLKSSCDVKSLWVSENWSDTS